MGPPFDEMLFAKSFLQLHYSFVIFCFLNFGTWKSIDISVQIFYWVLNHIDSNRSRFCIIWQNTSFIWLVEILFSVARFFYSNRGIFWLLKFYWRDRWISVFNSFWWSLNTDCALWFNFDNAYSCTIRCCPGFDEFCCNFDSFRVGRPLFNLFKLIEIEILLLLLLLHFLIKSCKGIKIISIFGWFLCKIVKIEGVKVRLLLLLGVNWNLIKIIESKVIYGLLICI